MTIDEAIRHCEEEAKEQDKLCKRYDDASGYTRSHNEEIRTSNAKRCEECAAEHRQLAEWLKELKRYHQAKDGLLEDMKALNCGFPFGLDYLISCIEKRLQEVKA